MRKFLLACSIAALGVAAAATKAEAYDWNGWYGGLNVGYGAGDADGDTSPLPTPAAFGAENFSQSVDVDGAVAGIQGGYNWNAGSWVFGIEADANWSDIGGEDHRQPLNNSAGTPQATWFQDAAADINWIATLRARAGYLVQPNTLLYATGGVAHSDVEFETLTSFQAGNAFRYAGSESESKTGWTAGAGVEWASSGSWSWKAEYLYYDLGSTDYVANPLAANPPYTIGQSFDTTGSLLRFGVNWDF